MIHKYLKFSAQEVYLAREMQIFCAGRTVVLGTPEGRGIWVVEILSIWFAGT